jgi:hypothetical protein
MDNFPISNIALTLDLDRALLKLSPLTFDIAGGHLASDIAINARVPAVVTDYDIRLSPTPMGRLLAKFGADESGTSGMIKARVQMRGVGDSVHKSLASSSGRIAVIMPAGTFWTRNVQLAELDIGTFVQKMFEKKLKEPVHINCGLIAFTVRDGIAAADPGRQDVQPILRAIAGRRRRLFRGADDRPDQRRAAHPRRRRPGPRRAREPARRHPRVRRSRQCREHRLRAGACRRARQPAARARRRQGQGHRQRQARGGGRAQEREEVPGDFLILPDTGSGGH